MTRITKSRYHFGEKLMAVATQLGRTHPFIAFIGMFVGMPLFVLLSVGICTTVVILPISWIFGWL